MRQHFIRFKSTSQGIKTEVIIVSAFVAIWIVMIILVNPYGNFPLNDDWAYGKSVQYLVEKDEFRLLDWGAMNLLSQVLWGALFCLPLGFSFTALRFSTLTLGLIGVIATYLLLKEVTSNRGISIVGAGLIAINPIYFGVSNTFMSDIPFFALSILSLLFLLRGLKHNSVIEIFVGIFLSYVALLDRQLAAAIFLAFGFAYVTKKGFSMKSFVQGFLPTFLGVCIQFFYKSWLQSTDRLPAMYNYQINLILKTISGGLHNIAHVYSHNILVTLMYLGLFVFPLFVILFPIKFKELSYPYRILTLLALSLFSSVVTGKFISKHEQMPLWQPLGNILTDFGLGPITLIESDVTLPHYPSFFWLILTLISGVGAALLLLYLFLAALQIFHRHSRNIFTRERWLQVLIISAMFIYFFPLAGLVEFFDRYVIFLLPLSITIVLMTTTNIGKWNVGYGSVAVALIMMLLYGGFTIGTTHDYLSWNRARWQALDNLMTEGHIQPRQIDGGFEFNGLYLYNSKYQQTPGKSWWWVDKNDYVVSFGSITGYEVVDRHPYERWLPLGQGDIFILHKIRSDV